MLTACLILLEANADCDLISFPNRQQSCKVVAMLTRAVVKSSWMPCVKMTSFKNSGVLQCLPKPMQPLAMPKSTLFDAALPCSATLHDPTDKVMPTQFIDAERQQTKDCGTGQPAQRGSRKPIPWQRRSPWFDRQWSLDMKKIVKAPATPYFPEGVPFTQIRKFQSFSGRSWKINAGRRRKIRLSLKRGRRKLL